MKRNGSESSNNAADGPIGCDQCAGKMGGGGGSDNVESEIESNKGEEDCRPHPFVPVVDFLSVEGVEGDERVGGFQQVDGKPDGAEHRPEPPHGNEEEEDEGKTETCHRADEENKTEVLPRFVCCFIDTGHQRLGEDIAEYPGREER